LIYEQSLIVQDIYVVFSSLSGTIQVYVGGQMPNQKKTVGTTVLHTSFQIQGQTILGK